MMDAATAELARAEGLGVYSLASCGARGPAPGLELLGAVASDIRAQDQGERFYTDAPGGPRGVI
ncbi:hypothetical protein FOA52_015359 [Chlamydomonas sp. UWO 241]|nr:hypothetical protein FOA52_015359 [Chlamydomonas sp. UWO 241]